jgi:hypothetical protein
MFHVERTRSLRCTRVNFAERGLVPRRRDVDQLVAALARKGKEPEGNEESSCLQAPYPS